MPFSLPSKHFQHAVQYYFIISLLGRGFPGIEDEENWHGKALGAKAEEAIAACKAKIQNAGPHGITPLAVVDDAPKFEIPNITLSEPPNYKLGEKVS